jgi:plastocyanin
MKTVKYSKIIKFSLFSAWLIFSFLSSSAFLHSGGSEGGTATLAGTVKVYRARHSGDVVVYLEGEDLKKEFPPPEKHSKLDQKNLVFIPRVLPILKGTTVDFLNSDDVQHNVFAPGKVEKFNLGTWGLGGVKDYTFNKPGEVVILCNVHSEMVAYIIILENPCFAKTDEKGNFKLENVLPGTYKVRTWHEKMKSDPQEISVSDGETKEIHLELKKRK